MIMRLIYYLRGLFIYENSRWGEKISLRYLIFSRLVKGNAPLPSVALVRSFFPPTYLEINPGIFFLSFRVAK